MKVEEQRFADAQPDLVIQDHECKRTFIVDIKVSNECEMNFAQNAALNMEKYSALRWHFERKGNAAHIITFQLGCLGSLSQEASHFLYKLLRNNRKTRSTIRVLSSVAAHSTRNIIIEHLTKRTTVSTNLQEQKPPNQQHNFFLNYWPPVATPPANRERRLNQWRKSAK